MYPSHNNYPIAKKVESLYQGRIRQFNDANGQYKDLNLPKYMDRARTDSIDHVTLEVYDVPNLERPSFKQAIADAEGQWREAKKGDLFGPIWSTHWFKISVRVPSEYLKFKEPILFDFDSSDEGLIYLANGEEVHGLSGEHRRTEFVLPDKFKDGEWHQFYIETSCNDIGGNGSPPNVDRVFRLNRADLVVPHSQARALNIDFWILGDCGREFPSGSSQKGQALNLLNEIINKFDGSDKSIDECRRLASEYLGDVNSSQVFKNRKGLVWSVGNCHIDTAWLWPYAETRRKIARSWSSQLDLLQRYPEYTFAASQAVQFAWLKEDHPELFKRVQKAVKTNRFIPIGGSWVECDTNMPSGESLVRQMVLGQRFFEQEFNLRSKVFWLPDTFGYAPQLPQICRLAGMPYFMTQKLSWNNIDVFPLSTFSWVGLDGSQVVCHMPPTNTYTAEAHFGDVKRSIEQHKNLDTSQDALMLFGYGDGGGGPTAEMIEKLRRCRGISNEVDLLPGTLSGVEYSPEAFFDTIVEKSNEGKSLPSWKGELYLEYHRGTYTTQARIKKGNRLSEALLKDLELFATTASVRNKQYSYPFEEITELWQLTCLNQFHDVLPGSGIGMIYEDANKIYTDIEKKARKLIKGALNAMGAETGDCLYSSANFHKSEVSKARVLADAVVCADLFDKKEEFDFNNDGDEDDDLYVLSNEYFNLIFDKGELVEIFDKNNDRRVDLNGQVSNQFLLLEDQPQNFPAWDTEQYATEKMLRLKPNRWCLNEDEDTFIVEYDFSESRIRQFIKIDGGLITFDTEVDWHETYQFLKVEFPVDIENDFATYETSFGTQRRPTHFNTSWDAAKFEVNGHRFADLSQYDYGVSLLNDCKYGYSIHGKSMRLSLLRAPKSPDANADMGTHHFRYALFPHSGPVGPQTLLAAASFNQPVYSFNEGLDPSLVSLESAPTVVVSSIKRLDADKRTKGTCRVIVRLYEAFGGKGKGKLNVSVPVVSARKVNVLEDLEFEDDEEELNAVLDVLTDEHDSVKFELNPFEVQTIMLTLKV